MNISNLHSYISKNKFPFEKYMNIFTFDTFLDIQNTTWHMEEPSKSNLWNKWITEYES